MPTADTREARALSATRRLLTAYSYTRLSTPEQLKGDGLRRQLERPQQWIDQHPELDLVLDTGLNLRDLGSAYRGDNATSGALGTFIAAIDSGAVATGSYLLVESLDRISRGDVMDIALPLFTSLLKKGIIIVTLKDNKMAQYEEELLPRLRLLFPV